ncbi:hypothetical protein [Lyngbya aestuarii]
MGTRTAADGGEVRPKLGRKPKLWHSLMKSEADAVLLAKRGVSLESA